MSLLMEERLYKLLPAVLRIRDAGEGEPLRALLGVIEGELERIEADTANLYDNWFIETCDEWVVPYIGDLLGVRPIRSVETAAVSTRAYVANTIAYRRRKGTAVVLEQLALDTTGWPARAVEFFGRLATTLHVNHVRTAPPATAALRDAALAELAGTAFEASAHTLDVRSAGRRGGRYNIQNIGLFLWRLRSHAVGAGEPGDPSADFTSARRLAQWWSVHPTGRDAPLFNRPRTETTLAHLAQEDNVPGPLRQLALKVELERLRRGQAVPAPLFMTDTDPVLRVWLRCVGDQAPVEVEREDMYVCSMPDSVQAGLPPPRALALDPDRGRLVFPGGLDVREVWVQCCHGFAGDLGGGPYDRGPAVAAANRSISIDLSASGDGDGGGDGFYDAGVWQAGVSHLLSDDGSGTLHASLRDAVAVWNRQPPGSTGVIVIMDSLSEHDVAPQALQVRLAEGSNLLIVGGQWPLEAIPGAPPGSVQRLRGRFDARQVRPHFVGNLQVSGTADADSANPGACFINGLLLEGQLQVTAGNLGLLSLVHSTLVPECGGLAVEAGGNERLQLGIERSICSAVQVAGPIRGINMADCIVDGGDPPARCLDAAGTALDLVRSTFFGDVVGASLAASDCIFYGQVQVLRRQTGCVRFSYLPTGSVAPRRYRCQPQLESAARVTALRAAAAQNGAPPAAAAEDDVRAEVSALLMPLFVSRRYGDPGYGQLDRHCAMQLQRGAESGAEMGAFEFLKQPQREANLQDALGEYLRFGLESGLFFVT